MNPPAIDPVVARRIKIVGIDVDGTLTDGGLYIGATRSAPDAEPVRIELKRFDIQDGMGMKLLQSAGLLIAVVTGRAGDAAKLRADELKVDEFVVSGKHKRPAFEAVLGRRGVTWREAAFLGDDLIDIPLMKRVALPAAVANAVAEVKSCARFTTRAAGGHGAVREFAEALLKARGSWDLTVGSYIQDRDGDASS